MKPSPCSPEELGSELTWQEVVSLLEDQASPFQAKEATLLSFIEAQEEVMAEDSLAWGWCRMVLQALEQGEDVTGKAIQQAKEVITSELPKSETPLPPKQVLGQQEREEDLAHGEGTDSETPSHEKVKPSASPDQYLSIMSANVTSFNNGALEWVTSSKAKVVCLQETHLTPELLHGRRATLQSLGWDLYAEPASLSDKGTRLGGTACAFPKNSGVWQKATYQCKGAGYTAVGLRQRRWDYTIVSLYLRDTEGLNGPTNAEVLSSLVAFVRTLPEPWIILGDWNLDPTEVQDTALIQVMRGRMIATGEATCNHGAELDFGVVSRSLEALVELSATWAVPWKPHAALHLKVKDGASEWKSWKLPQFPKLTADLKNQEWQEVQPSHFAIMDRTCAHEDQSTWQLATWAASLEHCHEAPRTGRGWCVQAQWGPLVLQRPSTAPKGSEVLVGTHARILEEVPASQQHLPDLGALQACQDIAEGTAFLTELYRQCSETTPQWRSLSVVARHKEAALQMQRAKEQQAQYKDWLQAGLAKGMRPLYSSLKKSERVLDRPFQNLPGEERPGARRKQWVAIWGEVENSPPIGQTLLDAAKSSPLFKITADVLEAILKNVTDKAGGLDGLTYAALKNLPGPAYEQLTQALNLAEATGVAPQHWQAHHVALLPKNADIERPITLTSITYRLWCFCRAQVVKKWMRETAEQFPWDKASPGNTCLETGMQRLLRGEVSRAANKHACAVLLDLQTFYDSVNWTKLEERIVATGFPPAIALLVMQVYRGTRYLVAEDLLSEGILPARGILAGCPFATMMARVYLQPIMQEAAQLRSITALDTWVDDIGSTIS